MGKITDHISADAKFTEDGLGLTLQTMFGGLEGILQSKTVVGDPVTVGDVILLPLVEVSAALAGGAFGEAARKNGAGAMTAKVKPVAMLCVEGDRLRLIHLGDQDAVSKMIDLIPDAVDRITGKALSPEVVARAREIAGKFGKNSGEEPSGD